MKVLKEIRTPWNKGVKINKPSNNSLNIPKDELYDLYINQKLTSNEIAQIYNCSSKTIRNWLSKHDIPIRDDGEAVKLERSKWSNEKELERSKKFHQTWLEKPQEEKDEMQRKRLEHPNTNSPESILKAHQTRLKNGTSNESISELNFIHKLELIGIDKDDIIHHYIGDSRYPFNCDFYIKSKDLFIEYQGHWTHGPEPFDRNNKNHLEYLNKMENKNINMSTWTIRDPKKLNTAINNKINLLLVYPRNKTYLIQNGKIITIDINDINKI